MPDNKLILTDDLFLGRGNHKEVFIHPTDKNLCVKILFDTPDEDFDREMRYRRALGKRVDTMTLLTKYHGEVDTDRGRGYVFENVIDFDGNESRTILSHIENPTSVDDLIAILLEFKRDFIEQKFVAAGMDPDNFMVQRLSPTERRMKIIDNIGTSARVPILYYSDFLMARRAKKYWRRFVREIQLDHGNRITADIAKRLLEN